MGSDVDVAENEQPMRPIKDHERPLVQTCFELAGLTLSDHIRVEPL